MANEFKIKNGLIVSGSTEIEQNLTVHGTITGENIISGSAQIFITGTTGYSTFSSSISSSISASISSLSASIAATDLSDDNRLDSLESASGSIRTDFNSFTSSYTTVSGSIDSRLDVLEAYSGSQLVPSSSMSFRTLQTDVYCKNSTGTQINKGTVVRIVGAVGDNPLIGIADPTTEHASANTLGITTQDIPNDDFGLVITEGVLIGVNTSGMTAGDLLYLGASGAFTTTPSVAPNHGVRLGEVLRVQQNQGSIYVRIDNGIELNEAHDVTYSSITHGDLLIRSGSVWKNSKSLQGDYQITGSLMVSGSLNVTGSIIPGANNLYDLGSSTHQFRHLYLSSASLYIDGTKVLGSTAQELQITTDTGQSFKILESGSDTITLQSADGNITLTSSGGGDVIMDPSTGIIALKGTTTLYAGNKIVSSDGNSIQFGNGVAITGSIVATGTNLISGSSQISFTGLSNIPTGIVSGSDQLNTLGYASTSSLNAFTNSFNTAISLSGTTTTLKGDLIVQGTTTQVDSTTINIADNIIQLNGTGATNAGLVVRDATSPTLNSGSLLWDTTNDKWIAGTLGSEDDLVLRTASQTLTNKTISGASNTLSNIGNGSLTNSSVSIAGNTVSLGGSISAATILSSTGVVSGSAQVTLSSTTGFGTYINQAVLTSSSPTFAGITNSGSYSQTTTSTQPVMIYGDSAGSNGLFRIQIDDISDSFGTGTRTYLGDGGNDIFIGTSNSSYTPSNTYIALNHGGEISMGAGSATKHFILSTSGDATFTGTGTFSGGGNTLVLKKGTGSPAIAFAGTSDQATGLIEGVSGGGVKIYTSTGTLSSPSWSTKVLITPTEGVKFGPNAVSIIGTEGSHGFHYLYSAGDPKIYLEANGVAAFLNPSGVGINTSSPSKRLTVNYGATGSDGLYVYGSQRQHTIFRSTGEHCFLYIDSFHQNTYLPVIHFQRSSTTYGSIGLNRASNSDALGSWTESEMYVGTDTNTPISLKVNNERIVIVSSSSMQVKSTILPTADATYNLGSTSLRWNNLYTTDLHLSNEGKQNVVDGTWGDWTLQEGESDIFMLNNRSGEKFKIKLEKIIQ